MIYYIKGDLFTSENSLAHCVSADLHMGAGIATIFKKKYNNIDKLKKQNIKTGGVCTLKNKERFIFYLVTKNKYYEKPKIEDLEKCLINLFEFLIKNDIRKISMPRIGCGLDKLNWNDVEKIIQNIFIDIDVYIYSLF